jgi:hypothetical protein
MKKRKPELDDVEVVFQPAALTEKDRLNLSNYIRDDKTKRSLKIKSRKRIAA